MVPALPDIVEFAEYRTYLKARYQAMRAKDSRFSHRYIAGRMGTHSAGWFGDLMSGRLKLRAGQIPKLAAVFKLDARETEFLSVLVDIERASNPEERIASMEKWLALKGIRKESVDKDRFAYFEHWHNLAVRELLGIRAFDGDYASLGAALIPPITAAQAQKAVDLLQRLGLVQPQVWNRRMTDLPVLVKAPAAEARHWNQILEAFGRLALAAVSTARKEERNFSALTLCLSPEGLKQAGEEIANLRKRLLIVAEKDKAKNRVFQCLFQVFPLTHPVEASR